MIHANLDFDRIKVLLFDADDTLRVCTIPGQSCPYRHGEWVLKPGVLEVIAKLPPHVMLGIVSNQGGVASGKVTYGVAYQMLVDLAKAAFKPQAWTEGRISMMSTETYSPFARLCHHSSRGNCICRKPSPFLLLSAALELHAIGYHWCKEGPDGGLNFTEPLQRDECVYVGDMDTDRQAATAAEFHFRWAHEFFPEPPSPPEAA